MLNDATSFEIIADTGEEGISALELAKFMIGLCQINNVAHEFLTSAPRNPDVNFDERLLQFQDLLEHLSTFELSQGEGWAVRDITFSNITTNSPLKFVGACSGISLVALALAVSVAGGEVEMQHGKSRASFKVNSLGDAAARLHAALNPSTGRPAAGNPPAGPRK